MRIGLRTLLVFLLLSVSSGRSTCAQSLFGDHDDSPVGVLLLRSGSSISGNFSSLDSGDAIAWHGTEFTRPFEFLLPAVGSINFPPVVPSVKMEGEFALELHSGDLISGKLIDWSNGIVELDSPRFGLVRIREGSVHRLDRIDENPAILFSGLSGLADWKSVQGEWKVEGTELWTRSPDSSVVGDFSIPDKAVVEFELSWKGDPNFSFAIGVDPASPAGTPRGWSFDTWNTQLILVRERPDIAAIEPLKKLDQSDNTVRLIAFVDQPAEMIRVYLPGGTLLTESKMPPPPKQDAINNPRGKTTGIAFTSHSGETRLKRLRVARWDGAAPLASDSTASRFRLSEGRSVSGQVVGFDRSERTLKIRDESANGSYLVDQIVSAEFPGAEPAQPRSLILSLQDQSRISGELLSTNENHLILKNPDVQEPVEVDRDLIRSVALRQSEKTSASNSTTARTGFLEIAGHRLTGHLEPATVTDDESCLVWKPNDSRTASPVTRTASGRIVYRETDSNSPAPPAVAQKIQSRRTIFGQLGELLTKGNQNAKENNASKVEEIHELHLLSGDVLPCRVEFIDERGVHFKSSSAEVDWIPHAKIKALDLKDSGVPLSLDEEKKQRLLTLPRNQKTSPPTHLLYSDRGDFLRCRVNSLVDERLVVELHLNEVELPLERISHIIWLHPEKILKQKEEATSNPEDPLVAEREIVPAGPPPLHDVQVILAGDKRSTFTPREINQESLIGNSDVIGACKYELASIDQIVFGEHIEVAARDLPYHQWVLTLAPDPLYVAAAAGGGPADDGRASAFVGKPAPDFKLELLNGEEFVLSQAQGKIIVLDFWATWCGPCMLTMPLMEEAMKPFDPERVRMISVNLEERPEQIKEVLERHKLTATVALDRDGVVARRYQVDSIPQLIIVDEKGTVARLFIGGGQNVVDQFTTALTEMLETPRETTP